MIARAALVALLLTAGGLVAPVAVARPAPQPAVVGAPLGLPRMAIVPSLVLGQTLSSVEDRAVESARAGRYAEAIALTTQLLAQDPDRLAARLVRGLAYYYTGQPQAALEDLDYALERADEPSGRTLRALVHLELGHYAEAVADAQRGASVRDQPPENLGANLLVIGRVLLARGQRLEATAYFQAVADLPDPSNARLARIALELLAAMPPGAAQPPVVRDLGGGFQLLELPRRWVRFQADNGVTAEGAASVARLLDARLAAVAAATGVKYSGTVELVVYKSEWELERAMGGTYRGPGRSRALRLGVRTGDWPWRQYLHVAITNPSLLFDLTHEAVHLVQAEVGLDDVFTGVPAWLVEGHAEHLAAVTLADRAPASVGLRLAQRGQAVAAAARANRLLDLRDLEHPTAWLRAQARSADLVYGQAFYAVALLHERHGVGMPLVLLQSVSAGVPFEAAFEAATGVPLARFYTDALEYTRQVTLVLGG